MVPHNFLQNIFFCVQQIKEINDWNSESNFNLLMHCPFKCAPLTLLHMFTSAVF